MERTAEGKWALHWVERGGVAKTTGTPGTTPGTSGTAETSPGTWSSPVLTSEGAELDFLPSPALRPPPPGASADEHLAFIKAKALEDKRSGFEPPWARGKSSLGMPLADYHAESIPFSDPQDDSTTSAGATMLRDEYDQLIIATHADDGARLLENADNDWFSMSSSIMRGLAGQITYNHEEVVLHTHTGLLGKSLPWAGGVGATDPGVVGGGVGAEEGGGVLDKSLPWASGVGYAVTE